MFIGHYAPAFIAAGIMARRRSGISDADAATETATNAHYTAWLGTMFVAAQLVDFGFFAMVLAGIENMRITPGFTAMVPLDLYDMPYSHSLGGTVLWSIAFAAAIALITKNHMAALLGFFVVLSHWFLDLLVHVPDLTLAGGEDKLGLGLWNYPAIAIPLELGITAAALAFYLTISKPRTDRAAFPATIILIALLILVQGLNWFGEEPERYTPSFAWTALAAFSILAITAHWAARQRRA